MRASLSILGIACLVFAASGSARAQTDGTYATDTGYSIDVKFEGDSLIVLEPNKRSEYRKKAGSTNEYEFTNRNNRDIRYGLRVLDAKTLGAYKPDNPASGVTVLKLRTAPAAGSSASATDNEKFGSIAQRYMERAQSDPDNVHVWTACGGAAFMRASSAAADADEFARQAASMIKPIMTRPGSPCPEVISNAIWSSAN
jgi:hypothetical protein